MPKLIIYQIFLFAFFGQNSQNQYVNSSNLEFENPLYIDFLLKQEADLDSLKYKKFIEEMELLINSSQAIQDKKVWNTQRLGKLFIKIHRKFLKTYSFNANFSGLINNGEYNCVTASIVFALILDRLEIKYEIHETPFHTYLKVWNNKGKCILLETTNATNGFIINPLQIEKMEEEFRNPYTEKDTYLNQNIFNKVISLEQLFALYFYNLGVEDFNHKSYIKAQKWLLMAKILYPEERIVALYQLNEEFISSQK